MASEVERTAECSFWKLSGKVFQSEGTGQQCQMLLKCPSKMVLKLILSSQPMEIPGTTTKVISGNDRHEKLNGVA